MLSDTMIASQSSHAYILVLQINTLEYALPSVYHRHAYTLEFAFQTDYLIQRDFPIARLTSINLRKH
jgi:hypothetical protein